MAGFIGLILIMLFMIIVYRVMGVVSSIALALYTALFCVILSIGHINLSLPGIAGIILTIGMAVDANVIIYERIKEELRAGKTLRSAIDTGYKNALTAIIDANITTIIAAVVLWWKGTGHHHQLCTDAADRCYSLHDCHADCDENSPEGRRWV